MSGSKKAGIIAAGVTSGAVILTAASVPTFAESGQAVGTNDSSHTETIKSGQSQAAVDLRVSMNNLLREHVTSSLNVTHAIAGDSSKRDVKGAMEAQYRNSDELSQAVGSVYGGEAQAQFSDLFREHIKESNKYAKAVEAGDNKAKKEALKELQVYLKDISAFLSTATGLPQQDIYGLLNEHEELINKSTNAYKSGDYVQAYQMEREALKEISRAADALSTGIIKSNPDKF